jgi:hypothetical protein
MKVLFLMHYPGYLRYYDSTVRLLAERGHTVYVAFDSPDKQREGAEALAGASERVVVLGTWPKRRDAWLGVARGARGTVDFVRYLHPEFGDAAYLRRRAEPFVPSPVRFLTRIRTLRPAHARLLIRALLAAERAIPSCERIEEFLRSLRPDVVVVTPLVNKMSAQTDMLKSARNLGIPTMLAVASWDHLTTKGIIRVQPDVVTVWNEAQRTEARELHGIPESNVVVTGAQPFDRWFERRPRASREDFCVKVGLPPDRPFVLFTGSTASISAPKAEEQFVRRWVEALRASDHPAVRDLAVLIRPHPYNMGEWGNVDLTGMGDVAVWPRAGANPVNEDDRADYFDSLYHSAAVVGINTSAMIEAAIVGRTVHTVRSSEFADTQGGTLHFRYLLPENGGFVRAATNLEAHVDQLADTLDRPEAMREQIESFVSSFVRPRGLERPCTPIVVGAIEELAASGLKQPAGMPIALFPLRLALRVLAFLVGAGRQKTAVHVRIGRRIRGVRRRVGNRWRRLPGRRRVVALLHRSVHKPGRNGSAPRGDVSDNVQIAADRHSTRR